MSIYELKPDKGFSKKRKILGRGTGSGLGKTSGKGHKGQKARSGGGVRLGFEGGQIPLYRRLAVRGFSNHPFKVEYTVVNLGQIGALFTDHSTVRLETLIAKGLIKKSERLVKILNAGDYALRNVSFEIPHISKSAQCRIEELGGQVMLCKYKTEKK